MAATLVTPSSRQRINVFGNYSDPGGVGRHLRNFAAALDRLIEVIPVHLYPQAGLKAEHVILPPLRRWDDEAPGISIFALTGLRMPPGRPRIVYTACEDSLIPQIVLDVLDTADQVWWPSTFCREIGAANRLNDDRSSVVPEGVDSDWFRPSPSFASQKSFRFLSVGKWEARKGIVDLIRTFRRCFSRRRTCRARAPGK